MGLRPSDPPLASDSVRGIVVGTWNLENLFRPGTQFSPRDDATYEAKLAGLASVIGAAAPDVLAVQEVGDPGGFDRPDGGDPWRLWNLAPLIPPEHASTRMFGGRRELIDHVLVSRFLVERTASADTGGVQPQTIGTDPRARRDERASDHAPVFARFDT